MKKVDINVGHSGLDSATVNFVKECQKASSAIKSIFRDGVGFMAVGTNGVECRIVAADPTSQGAYDRLFFSGDPFKGTVNVPESSDFGMTDEKPAEETPAEDKPAEGQPPADKTPPVVIPPANPILK